MGCESFRGPGGATVFACSRGRGRRQPKCGICKSRPATKLCDFPAGQGTCDRNLCDKCAVEVGPNTDHCFVHEERQPELPLLDPAMTTELDL